MEEINGILHTQHWHELEPEPLRSEIEQAMEELKSCKSPGTDGIPAELLKCLGGEGVEIMWLLCQKIWRTGEWPSDWKQSVFFPLLKKRDAMECSNHRTVSLISHTSEVLLKVINNRMKSKMKEEVSEVQAGFREGRGTRDHLVNLKVIIEKCRNHSIPLYICFIDYKKAFDCVQHTELWRVMDEMGFPKHLTGLISNLYMDQSAAVRLEGEKLTKWFKIGAGVRQGCILSPNLFSVYTERIMREALDGLEIGVNIGGYVYNNLRYADDTVLLATSREDLETILDRVRKASASFGLHLNTKKTKIMVINEECDDPFICEEGQVEIVDKMVYLGAQFDQSGKTSGELR